MLVETLLCGKSSHIKGGSKVAVKGAVLKAPPFLAAHVRRLMRVSFRLGDGLVPLVAADRADLPAARPRSPSRRRPGGPVSRDVAPRAWAGPGRPWLCARRPELRAGVQRGLRGCRLAPRSPPTRSPGSPRWRRSRGADPLRMCVDVADELWLEAGADALEGHLAAGRRSLRPAGRLRVFSVTGAVLPDVVCVPFIGPSGSAGAAPRRPSRRAACGGRKAPQARTEIVQESDLEPPDIPVGSS